MSPKRKTKTLNLSIPKELWVLVEGVRLEGESNSDLGRTALLTLVLNRKPELIDELFPAASRPTPGRPPEN